MLIIFFKNRMGVRAVQMKKVYATLKALLDVLAVLVGESASDGVGRLVMEEASKLLCHKG